MIERVIEFSAHNKFLVLILTAVGVAGAVHWMRQMPLDAIPDLSDTQVIIYSRWDRSPDIIEDQVTYPIVTAMLGAPKIKAIRGFSDFGFSYVYVIFQDGTDIYWVRSRTIEYLSKILPRLPEGVRTELGPDATSVGWIYQYALVDKTGNNDLAQLRTFQDWYLRYQLQSVPGVAEVASIGGFQKQYQVNVDPNALNAYNIPLVRVVEAIRDGNNDVGGRLLEFSGADLNEIERLGSHLEMILSQVPGTRSVFAERTGGGYFLDFELRRDQLARYGLTIKEAEMVLMSAVGGEPITTTVEGRERYTINVRYARDLRSDLDKLRRVLVPIEGGAQVPLAELASIKVASGPAMIRDENGMLSGYVYVDLAGRDIGSYVEAAKQKVGEELQLPTGYSLAWSGQYENMLRVRERLKVIVPITLFLIFVLLYMNTKSAVKASIVMLAVPFSLIGAVWYLWLLGYHISIAVWVGMIALMGLDAETGVFMLLFLDLSYYDAVRAGMMKTYDDLREAIIHGAVKRIRPKMMTVAAAMMGLLPIMWSIGTGSDMMKRIAAPMIGGLVTSFILELLVYPPIYAYWKWNFEMKRGTVDVATLPLPELRGH